MQMLTETGKKRMALGQGLDALLPLDEPVRSKEADREITYEPTDSLVPNPNQPRRIFSEESLAELSESIREKGVIQPLIVRPRLDGGYEIVAGERRWRAATMAGYSSIPVIVRTLSDSEALEISLIENLQREDLNPLDTAEAYDALIKNFSYTHEVLARRIGKDRTNITNYLRLLKLPDSIKEDLRQERLSMAHARTLLAVEHLPTQLRLSRKAVNRKLSVRELEKIVKNYKEKQSPDLRRLLREETDTGSLERGLSRHFSTKVVVRQKSNGYGKLEIHFHSTEELDRLLEIMGYSQDFS